MAVRLPVFKEGVQVLSDRFTAVAEAEEKSIAGGLLARTFSGFTEGILLLSRAPIGGLRAWHWHQWRREVSHRPPIFLLSEGEWGRVVLESGPILGLAYLVWRTMLTFKLGLVQFRAA